MYYFQIELKSQYDLSSPVGYWSVCRTIQQTLPTCDAESGNQTQATLVGGECSRHCAIPAPRNLDSVPYILEGRAGEYRLSYRGRPYID